MPSKRATRGAPAHGTSCSILLVLDEDALVEVLRAAKTARTLSGLASCSRQLCTLARSRVSLHLNVWSASHASRLLQSVSHGRPPFTGCTSLYLSTDSAKDCLLATAVLAVAVQWPALQQLELWVDPGQKGQHSVQELDMFSSGVLSALPALKQLRRLELNLPAFDALSAKLVGQLEHLTRIHMDIGYEAPYVSPAAHLTALSGLKGLQELSLSGPPPVQPAASPTGPFSLPPNLGKLKLRAGCFIGEGPRMGDWLTHLPGCPQLQHLALEMCHDRHPSTHPSVLVPLLAAHNRQLRTLAISWHGVGEEGPWSSNFAEEQHGAAALAPWRPTAALAALTGLERLSAGRLLLVSTAAEWRHLAQLTALTRLEGVVSQYAPPVVQQQQQRRRQQQQEAAHEEQQQQSEALLALVELVKCDIRLGGHGLGCLLVACPALVTADVRIVAGGELQAGAPPAAGHCGLRPHATLQSLVLRGCSEWDGVPAAHLSALAPVLGCLPCLHLAEFTLGSGDEPGVASKNLPNMSSFTALTSLQLELGGRPDYPPEQEDFLSMLAPLKQLRRLRVQHAEGLNPRAVVLLQHTLPQLQYVELNACGQLSVVRKHGVQRYGAEPSVEEQEQLEKWYAERERQLLAQVRRLLRRGLELKVGGIWCDGL